MWSSLAVKRCGFDYDLLRHPDDGDVLKEVYRSNPV
jgi:hypothetical protein